MPRKILFVNHTGQMGGAEIMLVTVAHHYRSDCHVVLFSDGPLRQKLLERGVSVSVLDSDKSMLTISRQGGWLDTLFSVPAVLRTAWSLAGVARHYDLLYPNSQKAAVITMLTGAFLRKPVIWYLHDILSAAHFSTLQRRVVVGLANHTTRWVLTNSQVSRNAFIASGGDENRISVAPCGVDSVPFDTVTETEVRNFRQKLGLEEVPVIGLFGRITPWKGQHVLIEALTQLPDVHALIVGDSLFGEDVYKQKLKELTARLGLQDRIHWLGFRQDVPRLMRSVDIIVHCSTSPEPYGLVIVEAMLAKHVIIAANDGASRELLGDDYPFLITPGEPEILANAIVQVRSCNTEEKERLVERNLQRARTLFSPERMLSDIDRVVSQVG